MNLINQLDHICNKQIDVIQKMTDAIYTECIKQSKEVLEKC